MGCGCTKNKNVVYVARFKDGTKTEYATQTEASQALRKAGGGTLRAVAKQPQ